MLCLFIYSTVVAQIDLIALIAVLIAIGGFIINLISVKQSTKKAKAEHDDKYVSKELLSEKIIAMNVKVISIGKEVDELKRDNQREHDDIKREFVQRLDFIFEWIKEKSK